MTAPLSCMGYCCHCGNGFIISRVDCYKEFSFVCFLFLKNISILFFAVVVHKFRAICTLDKCYATDPHSSPIVFLLISPSPHLFSLQVISPAVVWQRSKAFQRCWGLDSELSTLQNYESYIFFL